MSREFRWVGSQYFHSALTEAAESEREPRHPISQALSKLYAALAPLEHGSASYEAQDSGPDRVVLALQDEWPAIKAAVDELASIHRADKDLISEIVRQMNERRG